MVKSPAPQSGPIARPGIKDTVHQPQIESEFAAIPNTAGRFASARPAAAAGLGLSEGSETRVLARYRA